nr:DUF6017 domain-containing protein [Acutalibacter muris]
MAVFRVERTKDYTVMSNHHLKNMNLSLKAKGLLSMMLSLPDSWNYTTRGLAAICKEGVDAIRSAIQELEGAGYIVRRLLRGGNGRITDTEYVIYEQPQGPDTAPPEPERPDTRPPQAGGPDMSQPDTGNSYAAGSCAAEPDSNKAAQLNTNSSIKNQSNTQRTNTHSIHPPLDGRADAGMSEGICAEDILAMREQIQDQIDYDYLVKWEDPKQIDELVELMLEVELATDPAISIGRGKQYPTALVRERFRLITSDHIVGVQDSLRENRTQVRNPKAYLLAALFNAPTSTSSQTAMQVNCDYPRRC